MNTSHQRDKRSSFCKCIFKKIKGGHKQQPTRTATIKKSNNKWWKNVEKVGPTSTANGNVKWCCHLGKTMAVSQKTKHIVTI
jgi:hypothetical protein